MAVSLRTATNEDVAGVVRVIRAVYDEYGFTWDEQEYHADLYDLEAHYANLGHVFFVAEDEEGTIVGTAALEVFDANPGESGTAVNQGKIRVSGTDCSLERLYVDPQARKQGIGRLLLAKVIEEAEARGRVRMEMWSDKRFQDAHRLYEKLGARVVGERICDDPDVSPEWGLLLELSPSAGTLTPR